MANNTDINVYIHDTRGDQTGMTVPKNQVWAQKEAKRSSDFQTNALDEAAARQALADTSISTGPQNLIGTKKLSSNDKGYAIFDTETIGEMNGFQQITQIAVRNYNKNHEADVKLLNLSIALSKQSQTYLQNAIKKARAQEELTNSERYALAAMTGYSTYMDKGKKFVKITAPKLSQNFDYSDPQFLKRVSEGMQIAKSTKYANQFSESEAVKKFMSYVGDRTLTGSNNDRFDSPLLRLLRQQYGKAGTPKINDTYDIMATAKANGMGEFFDLRNLAKSMGISEKRINEILGNAQHTAEADIRLTAEIAKAQDRLLKSSPFKGQKLAVGQKFKATASMFLSSTK